MHREHKEAVNALKRVKTMVATEDSAIQAGREGGICVLEYLSC
jgi:hypothetical protein